jgi:hypothetical protein
LRLDELALGTGSFLTLTVVEGSPLTPTAEKVLGGAGLGAAEKTFGAAKVLGVELAAAENVAGAEDGGLGTD